MFVCVRTCVHESVRSRGHLSLWFLRRHPPFIFWDKVSSLIGSWSLLIRLGCLAGETKDLPVSTTLLLGVQTLTTEFTKAGSVSWTLGVERNISCTEISHCALTRYSRKFGIISQSSGDFQIPGFERNEDGPDLTSGSPVFSTHSFLSWVPLVRGCHNQIPTLHTPHTRVNIRRHVWNFVEIWILYLHQQNLKCCFCPERSTHFYSSPEIWRALYLTSSPKLGKGFFSNVSHSGTLLFLIPKRQTIWLKK